MASKKVPAKVTKIKHLADGRVMYFVQSQTQQDVVYPVIEAGGAPFCGCKGYQYRGTCAHVTAVLERKAEAAERKAVGEEAARKRDTAPLFRDNRPFSIFADASIFNPPPRGSVARQREEW